MHRRDHRKPKGKITARLFWRRISQCHSIKISLYFNWHESSFLLAVKPCQWSNIAIHRTETKGQATRALTVLCIALFYCWRCYTNWPTLLDCWSVNTSHKCQHGFVEAPELRQRDSNTRDRPLQRMVTLPRPPEHHVDSFLVQTAVIF